MQLVQHFIAAPDDRCSAAAGCGQRSPPGTPHASSLPLMKGLSRHFRAMSRPLNCDDGLMLASIAAASNGSARAAWIG
jgi:hypothetical protein